ncbi:LPXTG cell wall anchor domain-containing protein [Acidimicrobiia bacterium EGI L10123]|uniref:LPXTG cell wall anchor domain-containing protein n=1 Tax=Salinilacustrithrix flava TaxID=2957203 RepID=UPI003D7C1546|nr:LPXTG cell wall anchor domain-containing protein [Acidimicrobiia bacterium EGI L10123]
MRLSRLVPVLAAGALLAATTSPALAQSDPEQAVVEGVGTTTGALTLLGLDAGDLLSIDLLSDAGSANIDEDLGPRRAAAQIAALALESPAAGVSQVLPLLSAESTGAPDERSQAVTPIDNPVVSGAIAPLQLSALVDDAGATSLLSAGLADLDVLSGILTIAGTTLDLGSTALVGDAAGSRGIDLDALTVLDLEALLATLGIPLTDLPLDTLLGLLDGLGLLGQLEGLLAPLGLDIDGLSVDAIVDLVDGLVGELDLLLGQLDQVDALVEEIIALEDLQAALQADSGSCDTLGDLDDLLGGGDTLTELCSDVTGTLASITNQLTTLTAQLDALPDPTELTALVDDLLDQVRGALEAPLDLLSGQALLSLEGLDVTVLTKATDDVATSVADVTGTFGSLQVGELPVLGTLNLTAPTADLNGLLAQAEGLVGGVLGEISPALADLVSIRTMQETTSVEEVAGSVVSSAAFSGLEVEVLPVLGELTGLLDGLGGTDSLGAILEGLDLPLPTSGAPEVLELNALLAPITGGLPLLGALEEGLGLQVATLSQQSTFTPVAAQAPATPAAPAAPAAPAPVLPRTGSDDGLLLALAGAAVLAALGGRHLVRRNGSDA